MLTPEQREEMLRLKQIKRERTLLENKKKKRAKELHNKAEKKYASAFYSICVMIPIEKRETVQTLSEEKKKTIKQLFVEAFEQVYGLDIHSKD